jgi:hypothetical protein
MRRIEVETVHNKRNCLNCKFCSLTIIEGKLIAACRTVAPAKRIRKIGYCGFWQIKIIDLRLTNRLKKKNEIRLWVDFRDTKGQGEFVNSCIKKYIEEYGEDCNTCANALSSIPFIGCDLKVKDFTYQDEVFGCPYYEFKGFIEEE